MASYLSVTDDGNLTTNTTWKTVSSGTSAIQAAYTNTTDTTGSMVYNGNTQDITIALNEVIEGICMFCDQKTATGTVTVALSADSGTTDTKTVVVNATDLPLYPSWVFFKFAETLTGDGGTDYAVGIKASSVGNATFYRNATAANWTRLLRTDANPAAAPTSADLLYIVGEQTGQGTETPINVVMDDVVASGNDYGGLDIGNIGSLTYDITASHNPYLRVSNNINVWGDGSFYMGDPTGGAIPSTSTASLLMDSGSVAQYRFYVKDGGTFKTKGQTKTGTATIDSTCSSGQKVLTVSSTSGWLAGDTIGLAGTNRTTEQNETKIIDTVDSATQITSTVNWANTHSGVAPTKGHAVNLTRNVKIFGASLANCSQLAFAAVATIDIESTELYWLGDSTSNIDAVVISTTTGSVDIDDLACHDTENTGLGIDATGSVDVNGLVWFNAIVASSGYGGCLDVGGNSTSISIQNVTAIDISTVNSAILIGNPSITFKNIVVAGCGGSATGWGALSLFGGSSLYQIGDWDNIEVYCSWYFGFIFYNNCQFSGTIKNLKCWRNKGVGFGGSGWATNDRIGDIVLYKPVFFGNANYNIELSNTLKSLTIIGGTFDGDATDATPTGIDISGDVYGKVVCIDCDFGVTVAHTTADINISAAETKVDVELIHCRLLSTEFAGTTNLISGSIKQHYTDNTLEFTTYSTLGSINQDDTIRHTASGYSWKLTPSTSFSKLSLPGVDTSYTGNSFKVAVVADKAVTISAYVYEDASYNGNRARLVLIGGIVAGVGVGGTDSVDTATVASDEAWEQLTLTETPTEAGVMEFFIDCDGTAGNLYVDDITVTQAA